MSRLERMDLVSARGRFFAISAVLVVVSLVLLAIPPSLRPGIEFTAGTTTLLRFEEAVDQADLRDAYAALDHDEARIQSTGANEFLIRTAELEIPEGSIVEVVPDSAALDPQADLLIGGTEEATDPVVLHAAVGGDVCTFGTEIATVQPGDVARELERHDDCADAEIGEAVLRVQVGDRTGLVLASETRPVDAGGGAVDSDLGERGAIEAALREQFGEFDVLEFASVSEVVSSTAVRNATVAVLIASLFIMGYVAFAFSSLPRPFRYATAAIIALLHDVIIVLGAFSLLGKVAGVEINLMFVTGLLTVIGFSVHDSIVVFDRVRENIQRAPHAPLERNVNAALVQTLGRSLNTSITLVFAILALLLLGGVTIREFLLVMLVGVVAGTYSSIAIAAQVLVAWERGDFRRWLRLGDAGSGSGGGQGRGQSASGSAVGEQEA